MQQKPGAVASNTADGKTVPAGSKKAGSASKKTTDTTEAPQRKHARREVGPFGKFLRVLVLILFIIFVIGALSVAAIGAYFISDVISYSDSANKFDLDSYTANQNQTSIIYGKNSSGKYVELTRLHGVENRIWVDLEDIPENLQNAYIALEDKRFMEHHGVDWYGTISVSIRGFHRGGSSITQQLIKNLTGESGRSFSRKYKEIKNALYLEKHYSKDTILEAYLNTLYLDAGCYGVKTASEYYFGKDVKNLTLAECATIAAITKAPRTYNPIINYDNNRTRMQLCLNYMYEQGFISEQEYKDALTENIVFTGARDDIETAEVKDETTEINSYYVDYVIDTVIDDLVREYDLTQGEAFRKLYYGGLKVYCAVDANIQSAMEEVYYNRIGIREESGTQIQSAMTVMDYNGRVLGIIGRLGEKTANRVLNIATDSPRQPGSSIKPLSVYAPAIDTGEYYWSSMTRDYSPLTLSGSPWPRNYGGGTGSGAYVTLAQAIAPSLNTVPAAIVDKLGVETCYKYLTEKFHITTVTRDGDMNYSSLAVGGMNYGVTSLEMTAAYAVFGNGGRYYTPWCYYKVESPDGTVLLQPDLSPEQVISEASANVMNHLLQEPVNAYDGTAVQYKLDDGYTMFAKTGTTSDNYDMWFCGGTPYYVAAVWSGYERNEEINKSFFGGSPAGLLWDEVMNRIHTGLDADKEFEDCEDCVKIWYCRNSGLRATSTCSGAYGYFTADNIPSYCSAHYYATTVDPDEEDEDKTTAAKTTETTTNAKPETTTDAHTTAPTTVPPPETTKAPERTTVAETTTAAPPPVVIDEPEPAGDGG